MSEYFPVIDFSGGITDFSHNAAPNQAEVFNNIIPTEGGHGFYSRYGSVLFTTTVNRTLNGEATNKILEFLEYYFIQSGRHVYLIDEGTPSITDLIGPTGNLALSAGSSTLNFSSHDDWQKHIYMTNDAWAKPIKIFQDENNTWQVRTAGLPALATTPTAVGGGAGSSYIYAFVKHYIYYVGSVRYEDFGEITYVNYTGATPDVTPVVLANIDTINNGLLDNYDTTSITRNGDTVNLSTTVSNLATTADLYTGMAVTGVGIVNGTRIASITDATTIELDRNATATATNALSFFKLMTHVYRTEDGGTTLYYVGAVANGVATMTDGQADATINTNDDIYNSGGIKEYETPPLSKYLTIVDNTAYYLSVNEDSEEKGFRLRQSIPGIPGACPGEFYMDFEEEGTGLSSIGNVPIVFTKTKTYAITSRFDRFGGGGLTKRLLSDRRGCVSNDSIVRTDDGLYFAGNVGFCFTDGNKVYKLSGEINNTYKQLILTETRARQIYGSYDSLNQHIWWAVQKNAVSNQNETCFILHEKLISAGKGFNNLNGVFTTVDNFSYFQPTAILFDSNNRLIRGDSRGYFFKHDIAYRNDPKVDPTKATSLWSIAPIRYDYKSVNLSCNSNNLEKWGVSLTTKIKNVSNVSCQPLVAINAMNKFSNLDEIRRREQINWNHTGYAYWNQSSFLWENSEDIDETRDLPSDIGLRFKTIRVRYTNALTIIENSDDRVTATVSATPMTITLDDPTYKWAENCDGHYISLEDDGYVENYFISDRVSDTVLQLVDPFGTLSDGSKEWIMRGYAKDELFYLVEYTLSFYLMDDKTSHFDTSSLGENA